MCDVDINMKAKNSSGEQTLYLSHDDGEYYFTLCGTFNEKPIQIDFDEMNRGDLEEMKAAIELILEVT